MSINVLNGDVQFLSLSRTSPERFQTPTTFTLSNGCTVTIPGPGIIAFEPPVPGKKDIVLSCGVHGNETAPIEICDELVQGLLSGGLQARHRVLFLFGNLPAMDIAERFVEENMNRLFSGAHSQGPGLVNDERRRAKALEDAIRGFYAGRKEAGERLHYDLHTAIRASKNDKFAVYPFLHGKAHSREQLQFLLACGVNTILLSESPTTTFSYFSSTQFGAHAFTVELGKVKPFGHNNMDDFADAKATLTSLIVEANLALPPFDEQQLLLYRVNQVINREKEDFSLHFADDVPNFTDYSAGTLLASEPGVEYRAQQDGEAIVFPNAKVALGQRALLTVVPTTLDEQKER